MGLVGQPPIQAERPMRHSRLTDARMPERCQIRAKCRISACTSSQWPRVGPWVSREVQVMAAARCRAGGGQGGTQGCAVAWQVRVVYGGWVRGQD